MLTLGWVKMFFARLKKSACKSPSGGCLLRSDPVGSLLLSLWRTNWLCNSRLQQLYFYHIKLAVKLEPRRNKLRKHQSTEHLRLTRFKISKRVCNWKYLGNYNFIARAGFKMRVEKIQIMLKTLENT